MCHYSLQLSKNQAEGGLSRFSVVNTIIRDTCPPSPQCPDPRYSYRTLDGSCNNLIQKDWGKTGATFTRMMKQDYQDGNIFLYSTLF